MHNPETKSAEPLGLHPHDGYLRAAEVERPGTASINCAQAALPRVPWEVGEDLRRRASIYQSGTPEHRLLTEAAELIFRQEQQIAVERTRADRAERRCQSFNDKIHLALLALRSPTVD